MKASYLILYPIIFVSQLAYPQTTGEINLKRQTFNTGISVFGNASLASFDFESSFKVKKDMHVSLKAGIGQNIIEHDCQPMCLHTRQYDMATFPLSLVSLIYVSKKKKGQAFLEIGIGNTFAVTNGNLEFLIYPILGYRIYPFKYLPIHYRIYTHLPISRGSASHFSGYYAPFGLSAGYSL